MESVSTRSAFVPLLFLGLLVLGAVGFACFVPVFECPASELPGSWLPRTDEHLMSTSGDAGDFLWECRACEGKVKTTVLQRILSREDGVPPPDAIKVISDGTDTD